MLIPLVGLILGIATLLYAFLAYTGSQLLNKIPIVKQQKGNLPLTIGIVLLAVALMLGIVGYYKYINAEILRFFRGAITAIGLLLAGYQFRQIWVKNYSFSILKKKVNSQLQRVWRYWELLLVLVGRNLKVRYRGSFLGVYWSLLNPMLMTGVYTAIFGDAFKNSPVYENSIVKYALVAFTGLIVINFFSAATTQALVSVVGNGALLNKIRLPVSIFPVSMVAANVFQFAVGLFPLLAIITLINSKSWVNVVALLLPSLAMFLVCTGMGFLVSALFVFFRDLPYFYELIVFILWLSSPIFYPKDIVPKTVQPYLALNPLSSIIESLRQVSLSGQVADFGLIWQALLSGVIILTFGWVCFHWLRHQFMDLL